MRLITDPLRVPSNLAAPFLKTLLRQEDTRISRQFGTKIKQTRALVFAGDGGLTKLS
jgi:hypothetical protein